MKKICFILSTLLISICLIAQTPKTIRIHEKTNTTIPYSSIFESARLVKLETRPDCLISNASTIKTDENRIFIYDAKSGVVFIFSQDGSFIAKISKKGKGPGEMITPRGFILDQEKKQVEILDASGMKMHIFDYNGNYLKTNPSVFVLGFDKINDSDYIGYSYNGPFFGKEGTSQLDLAIFNNKGQIVKEFKNVRNTPRSLSFVTSSNLVGDNQGNVYFVPIFENRLFRVDPLLSIEMVCDFMFDTRIQNNILLESADLHSAIKVLSDKKYPYLINGLSVINNRVHLIFTYDHQIFHTFWNINSDTTTTVADNNLLNDLALFEFSGFSGTFQDGVIDAIDAIDLLESYSKIIEKDKSLSCIQSAGMRTTLASLIKATTVNDNPVLIFYSYK